MNATDRDAFAGIVTMLAETLGGELGASALEGYWLALGDLAIEDVRRAAGEAMRTSKFFPRPAELRALVSGPAAADRAVLAWAIARQAMCSPGRYASVDFEDQAINAALRSLGGWERVCGLEGDEVETWARKEFLRAYEAFARVGCGELGGYLPGIVERGNSERYESPPPRRIACPGLRLASGVRQLEPGRPPASERRRAAGGE